MIYEGYDSLILEALKNNMGRPLQLTALADNFGTRLSDRQFNAAVWKLIEMQQIKLLRSNPEALEIELYDE